ncbi:MAG: hypothetical protein H9535_03525 [Ignavibacteria bacterium]|nr:hypothetical protein [Ignavibacteria bacterium]
MGYIPDPEDMAFTVINQEPSPEEMQSIREHIAGYRRAHPVADIPAWMKEPLVVQMPTQAKKASRTPPIQINKAHA